jgi:hypothetical protein
MMEIRFFLGVLNRLITSYYKNMMEIYFYHFEQSRHSSLIIFNIYLIFFEFQMGKYNISLLVRSLESVLAS